MRTGVFGLAFVSLSLALAGCGGRADEEDQAASDQEAAATPQETAAAPAAPAAATPPPAADSTDTIDGKKLADLTGDAAHGEKVFLQCKACHTLEEGKNMIGPSLHGIIGRHSGSIATFNYSAANKNSGITWTPEKLFQYLESPQRVIPGTKMTFAGLPQAQDRADVIAYLQANAK